MFALVQSNDFDSKLSELKKEIVAFFPHDDDQFSSMVDMALVSFQLDYNQEIQNKIVNEFKKQASLNIINIRKKINEKKHLTKVQISIIERSHIHYLQQQFFNIIKEISDNYFVKIYFEKNINVLNEQIKNDRIEIQILFNRFRADWNKKETIIEKSMKKKQ